jgi:hypothetical protein
MTRVATVLLVLTAAAGAWTAWRIAPIDRSIAAMDNVSGAITNSAPKADTASIDSLSDLIVGRNLFRPSRSPASVGWLERDEAPALPPRSPRPILRLTGLIKGSPPAAVIDGVPGVPAGAVMVPGDTVQGLLLEAIVGDTARVIGADTTWILILRQASQ